MPSLTVAANRWRLAWSGIAAVIVLTVITGFTLGYINRHRVLAALPPATDNMPDPALMRAGSDWPAYSGSHRVRRDRKSVVAGQGVAVRVDLGGRRTINKNNTTPPNS